MKYVFIVNGRYQDEILPGIQKQIDEEEIDYEIHVTKGKGEGTLFVNIYCDLNPKDEICFVACGGSGTVNEVVSALVQKPNKYLAVIPYSKGSNDFLKCFPDRDFTSLKGILEGEAKDIDIMKVNDNYSLNVINIGFDAAVARYANDYIAEGYKDGYRRGIRKSVFFNRFNHIKIVADGEKIIRHKMLLANVANGRYCGGEFLCAPNADPSDGLMEVCAFKTMTILGFLLMLKPYSKGEHLTNKYCLRHLKYKRAEHVTLSSKDLFAVALDGEIFLATSFDISIIHNGISLILPPAR